MEKTEFTHAIELAGIGLLAGLAGTLVMTLSQTVEISLTGRKSSKIPAKAVEKIADRQVRDPEIEKQLATAAHLAFGTGLGLGLAALSKVPEPARGAAFFAGAWGAGTSLIVGLGLSDAPTKWEAKKLATDLGHHAVYAASAAAAFLGLRRLARI